MASGIGTKRAGFVHGKYGPFKCGNCALFDAKAGACNSPEVKADPEVTDRVADGRPRVDADDCSNFFWPRGVTREQYAAQIRTRSPHGFAALRKT